MARKTLVALTAAITLALPAANAFAGINDMDVAVDGRTGMETRSIAVSMADLNLASTHGARMADSRITKAAKKRSEEHTSELQSLMRISYAVFCLKKKKNKTEIQTKTQSHSRTTQKSTKKQKQGEKNTY